MMADAESLKQANPSLVLNGSLAYTYPYSKLLGARPCGKVPTPKEWVALGGNSNIPVYKNAPNENCGTKKSCTPQVRFKDGDNNLAIARKELRQANNRAIGEFPNPQLPALTPVNAKILRSAMPFRAGQIGGQTPFRALMNAGDTNLSVNKYAAATLPQPGVHTFYSNPPNQVSSTRRASNASAVRMSGYMPKSKPSINSAPGGGGQIALWSGNSKWVYDGADYVRFKKLQAKNRNFNDISWGGDRNNASQVALARVRH